MIAHVGRALQEALNAVARRADAEANGLATAPSLLAECLARVPGFAPETDPAPRLADVTPWHRAEWQEADLAAVPSGALAAQAVGALREAGWRAAADRVPAWDVSILAALRAALAASGTAGTPLASPARVAVALLRDPDVRTQDVLRAYRRSRPAAVRHLDSPAVAAASEVPWTPAASALAEAEPRWRRPFRRLAGAIPRPRRASGSAPVLPPVLGVLAAEADRLAVRLSHHVVEPVHLVLATASLEDQLSRAVPPVWMDPGARRRSEASARLWRAISPAAAVAALAVDLAAPGPAIAGHRPVPGHGPQWSADAADALSAAATRETAIHPAGSDDLLHVVLGLDDPAVSRFLQRCGSPVLETG